MEIAIRSVGRCAVLGVAAAFASVAFCQAPSRDALNAIAQVIAKIEAEYIVAVDSRRLVAGCRGMLREGLQKIDVRLQALSPVDESLAPIEQIRRTLEQVAIQQPSTADLLPELCKAGMVRSLDDSSVYLPEHQLQRQQEQIRPSMPLAGIGLELQLRKGRPTVVSAIEGTPAHRAGLRENDVILKIDDFDTRNSTLTEAITKMRGKPGSVVTLTLEREGRVIVQDLRRAIIRLRSVSFSPLPDRYLHLRVSRFLRDTFESFVSGIRAELSLVEPAGIVLDLRGNSGGLLYPSAALSAAFLAPSALIVETRARGQRDPAKIHARAGEPFDAVTRELLGEVPDLLRTLPLVVLVDRGTAAGAEIVAAALQDHRRGNIIGEPTAGFGTLQTVVPLPDGTAMRITTSNLFRPNGEPLERRPVVPDIRLSDMAVKGSRDPVLEAAHASLKKNTP